MEAAVLLRRRRQSTRMAKRGPALRMADADTGSLLWLAVIGTLMVASCSAQAMPPAAGTPWPPQPSGSGTSSTNNPGIATSHFAWSGGQAAMAGAAPVPHSAWSGPTVRSMGGIGVSAAPPAEPGPAATQGHATWPSLAAAAAMPMGLATPVQGTPYGGVPHGLGTGADQVLRGQGFVHGQPSRGHLPQTGGGVPPRNDASPPQATPASSWIGGQMHPEPPQVDGRLGSQMQEQELLLLLAEELTTQHRLSEAKDALSAAARLSLATGGSGGMAPEILARVQRLRWRAGLPQLQQSEVAAWLGVPLREPLSIAGQGYGAAAPAPAIVPPASNGGPALPQLQQRSMQGKPTPNLAKPLDAPTATESTTAGRKQPEQRLSSAPAVGAVAGTLLVAVTLGSMIAAAGFMVGWPSDIVDGMAEMNEDEGEVTAHGEADPDMSSGGLPAVMESTDAEVNAEGLLLPHIPEGNSSPQESLPTQPTLTEPLPTQPTLTEPWQRPPMDLNRLYEAWQPPVQPADSAEKLAEEVAEAAVAAEDGNEAEAEEVVDQAISGPDGVSSLVGMTLPGACEASRASGLTASAEMRMPVLMEVREEWRSEPEEDEQDAESREALLTGDEDEWRQCEYERHADKLAGSENERAVLLAWKQQGIMLSEEVAAEESLAPPNPKQAEPAHIAHGQLEEKNGEDDKDKEEHKKNKEEEEEEEKEEEEDEDEEDEREEEDEENEEEDRKQEEAQEGEHKPVEETNAEQCGQDGSEDEDQEELQDKQEEEKNEECKAGHLRQTLRLDELLSVNQDTHYESSTGLTNVDELGDGMLGPLEAFSISSPLVGGIGGGLAAPAMIEEWYQKEPLHLEDEQSNRAEEARKFAEEFAASWTPSRPAVWFAGPEGPRHILQEADVLTSNPRHKAGALGKRQVRPKAAPVSVGMPRAEGTLAGESHSAQPASSSTASPPTRRTWHSSRQNAAVPSTSAAMPEPAKAPEAGAAVQVEMVRPNLAEGFELARPVRFRPSGCFLRMDRTGDELFLPIEHIRPRVEASTSAIRELMQQLGTRCAVRRMEAGQVSMLSASEASSRAQELAGRRAAIEAGIARLRTGYDPKKWIQGRISTAQANGIYVSIIEGKDAFVPVAEMPSSMTRPMFENKGDRLQKPSVEVGETVDLRVIRHTWESDSFLGSMLTYEDSVGRRRVKSSSETGPVSAPAAVDSVAVRRHGDAEQPTAALNPQTSQRLTAKGFSVVSPVVAAELNAYLKREIAEKQAANGQGASKSAKLIEKKYIVNVVRGMNGKVIGNLNFPKKATDKEVKDAAVKLALKEGHLKAESESKGVTIAKNIVTVKC